MAQKKDKKTSYVSHGMVAENRKARREFEILETVEAGLVLLGSEVKALRTGRANIGEAYAIERGGEFYLQNAHFGEWHGSSHFSHEPRRLRKLLLTKRESKRLLGQVNMKGMTIVPLKLYFNHRGYAKLLLGLAKGRKAHEKRDVIKERDSQREIARAMKDRW